MSRCAFCFILVLEIKLVLFTYMCYSAESEFQARFIETFKQYPFQILTALKCKLYVFDLIVTIHILVENFLSKLSFAAPVIEVKGKIVWQTNLGHFYHPSLVNWSSICGKLNIFVLLYIYYDTPRSNNSQANALLFGFSPFNERGELI